MEFPSLLPDIRMTGFIPTKELFLLTRGVIDIILVREAGRKKHNRRYAKICERERWIRRQYTMKTSSTSTLRIYTVNTSRTTTTNLYPREATVPLKINSIDDMISAPQPPPWISNQCRTGTARNQFPTYHNMKMKQLITLSHLALQVDSHTG